MAASGIYSPTPVGGISSQPYDTLDTTPMKEDIPSTLTYATPTPMGDMTPASYSTTNYGAGVMMDEFEIFSENSQKEKNILRTNRVKLIEYIHDCKVLFPYMKQKNVFTTHECEIIQHEVTGKQRMDKFIDIVLTKGPEAIGVFHESLRKDYPFVFDILTRLFSSASIDLPQSRQLREDPDDTTDLDQSGLSTISMMSSRSFQRPTNSVRQTIRRQMDELHRRCEQVKSQRDDLQQALLQRERDINALLSHRDQQIQQKYEDMLTLLAKWRETMTNQSDGSIQKMQELLSEQEDIKNAYEEQEGEYMLVLSELSAARDRIAKLLAHLEKMETEFALAQEEKERLNDKISLQQGEIERLERRQNRTKKTTDAGDVASLIEVEKVTTAEQCSDSHDQVQAVVEDSERRVEVAQKERKEAISKADNLQFQLYEEKLRFKKLEEQLRRMQGTEGPVAGVGKGGKVSVIRFPSCPPSSGYEEVSGRGIGGQGKVAPLVDEEIVMPADDMGMKLGMAVVVCDLMDGGNAVKAGVKLGDEICQVNHIKVSSDMESLAFAQRLLMQASSTVTLSIKRQSPGNSSPFHYRIPSPSSHPSTILGSILGASKESLNGSGVGGGRSKMPKKRPLKLIPGKKNLASISRVLETQRDTDSTSDGSSQELRDDLFSVPDNLSPEEDGIITSPTGSMNCRGEYILLDIKGTCGRGLKRGGEDSRSSLSILDSPSDDLNTNTLYDSDSTDPHTSLESTPRSNKLFRRHVLRPNKVAHQRRRRDPDLTGNKRLSKSLDDLEIVERMLHSSREDALRQVILPFGRLGFGLSIIGGRGNGLYIRSERHTERSFKTGDQIIEICGKLALKMTYSDAIELMTKYNTRGKESVLTVKTNKEGYEKLHYFSRDNFFVRAKVYHKSRNRLELGFNVGDIFHVIDTKPKEQSGVWQVKRLNSQKETVATGYIPVSLDSSQIMHDMGARSLPRLKPNAPMFDKKHHDLTLPPTKSTGTSMTSTQSAFKLYQPVKELPVEDLRPVVLFGVYESELRECLAACNLKQNIKFGVAHREPKEKIAGDGEVIESIHTKTEGVLQSTVKHVLRVARSGRHCVLSLTPSDLSSNSRITSLHPIILALDPSNTSRIKVKPMGNGFDPIGPSSIQTIKERIRSVRPYVTGELSVSSPVNVDELLAQIVDTVAEQQKHILWELDLP